MSEKTFLMNVIEQMKNEKNEASWRGELTSWIKC